MPQDSLRAVFTPVVINRLLATNEPTQQMRVRQEILTLSGSWMSERERCKAHWVRAKRAAWEAYLDAAFASGLFEGGDGTDLRNRLTSRSDEDFRSAMAECFACWVFRAKLNLIVTRNATERGRRTADFLISHLNNSIDVEVKAPFVEMPKNIVWSGDNSVALASVLDDANRQFSRDSKNLLVIVTNTEHPLFGERDELVRAFFGEEVYRITFNRQTGERVNDGFEFSPKGRFLRRWQGDQPRFTRVGAVLRLRERLVERRSPGGFVTQMWMEPDFVILHNPFALNRIGGSLWGDAPQLVEAGPVMRWNDGGGIDG